MVNQITRVNSVPSCFEYITNVYEPSLSKYQNNNNYSSWKDAQNAIEKGRKILEFDEEVDTYIAFYGAHHYYKLVEAFEALNISRFNSGELEIFSYGCGAATATCSLISYCRERQTKLPFQGLTLIEPSRISLNRGVEYIEQALFSEESDRINIQRIYKIISQLKKSDLASNSKAAKLHLFSNILDVKQIDLRLLASLIRETQSGTNYFICVNPKNKESKDRIDNFYNNLSNSFTITDIDTNDEDITGKLIWMMNRNKYTSSRPICRYHRIFKADAM